MSSFHEVYSADTVNVNFRYDVILKLQHVFETPAERVFGYFPYLGNGRHKRVECGIETRRTVEFIYFLNIAFKRVLPRAWRFFRLLANLTTMSSRRPFVFTINKCFTRTLFIFWLPKIPAINYCISNYFRVKKKKRISYNT